MAKVPPLPADLQALSKQFDAQFEKAKKEWETGFVKLIQTLKPETLPAKQPEEKKAAPSLPPPYTLPPPVEKQVQQQLGSKLYPQLTRPQLPEAYKVETPLPTPAEAFKAQGQPVPLDSALRYHVENPQGPPAPPSERALFHDRSVYAFPGIPWSDLTPADQQRLQMARAPMSPAQIAQEAEWIRQYKLGGDKFGGDETVHYRVPVENQPDVPVRLSQFDLPSDAYTSPQPFYPEPVLNYYEQQLRTGYEEQHKQKAAESGQTYQPPDLSNVAYYFQTVGPPVPIDPATAATLQAQSAPEPSFTLWPKQTDILPEQFSTTTTTPFPYNVVYSSA